MNDWWAFTRAWKARREAERAVRSLERERWNDMIVVALGVIVVVALIIFGTCPAHAGGDGATDHAWSGCPKCPGCDDVAESLANCKAALTKRVPCDSCCGEDDEGFGRLTGRTTRGVPLREDPGSSPGQIPLQDSTGADNAAVNRRDPSGEATAGIQPGAPDSNGGEKWSSSSGSSSSAPSSARSGSASPGSSASTPTTNSSWHPAAGLSLLNAAWLGHLGAEHRGQRVHWLLLGTVGRVNQDGETVQTFRNKHPGGGYGDNDYEPAGSRTAGGGSDTLYGATGIVTW